MFFRLKRTFSLMDEGTTLSLCVERRVVPPHVGCDHGGEQPTWGGQFSDFSHTPNLDNYDSKFSLTDM